MSTQRERGLAKKHGLIAGKEWIRNATNQDIIDVAGSGFTYGMTLADLRDLIGTTIPESHDGDFSWGFYKQVKGHVHFKLYAGSMQRVSV